MKCRFINCIGNDFLPHIPTLEISEAAVTNISQYYRELLPSMFVVSRSDFLFGFALTMQR
jgi:5'-3' exonuclease